MNLAQFVQIRGLTRTPLTGPIVTDREFRSGDIVRIAGEKWVVIESGAPREIVTVQLTDGRIVRDAMLRTIRVMNWTSYHAVIEAVETDFAWPTSAPPAARAPVQPRAA